MLLFIIITISLTHAQSTSSLCSQYSMYGETQCECKDLSVNGKEYISLTCTGISYVPHFLPNVQHQIVELDSCTKDLSIRDKIFADISINTLRIRRCNLNELNEQSFSRINNLEKLYMENSTINSLQTSSGNFQDVFDSDSFQTLRSLTLKNVHYHQTHKQDKKLNLELLLRQLPNLTRLELVNIYLDNFHYENLTSIGSYITYLKLINTHQKSLLPIEHLHSLEFLILVDVPKIFHNQTLISSIRKLKKLKHIDLTRNQLKSIDGLQSKTIDQIDLTGNLIENIDEYTFEHVPKLHTLTLNGNPLQSIDKNAFCGVENLERLYINKDKTNQISPIDNCILISHPNLDIKQNDQAKFECNCQLLSIFNIKRYQTKSINRLFNPHQHCIMTNNSLMETTQYEQLLHYLNLPIDIYQFENYFNCSLNDECNRICQDRKLKLKPLETSTSIGIHKSNIHMQQTKTSSSSSLYSSFTYLPFSLLLAFLYL